MTRPVIVKDLSIGEGMPKICVPVVGKIQEEIYKQAALAVHAQADLVEWRADFYGNLFSETELSETLQGLSDRLGQIPLLFTIRTSDEGGNLPISTEDYVNINQRVSETGMADLIDVEFFKNPDAMKELVKGLQKRGSKVIASSHDFQKTDDQQRLIGRLEALQYSGADIVKMAVMPESTQDVTRLLQVTRQFALSSDLPLITMSMGEIGAMSRMTGEIFSSAVTFAVAGEASAPGQMPVEELREMLQIIHETIRC